MTTPMGTLLTELFQEQKQRRKWHRSILEALRRLERARITTISPSKVADAICKRRKIGSSEPGHASIRQLAADICEARYTRKRRRL